MNRLIAMQRQRGVVTIFVSMILLVLITLLVITAYSLSRVNLQAVGNVQAREEALAAANVLIDRTMDIEFWNIKLPQTNLGVDLNGDGVDDFLVDLAAPRCVRFDAAAGNVAASVTLQGMQSVSAWNTVWELDATAREATTGTQVQVIQGVRVLLSTALKQALCEP